jgi:multidrug efflux pump subunit AcrA (membrane-fusion protein)
VQASQDDVPHHGHDQTDDRRRDRGGEHHPDDTPDERGLRDDKAAGQDAEPKAPRIAGHHDDSWWHRIQHWLIERLGGEHPHADAHGHGAGAPEILTATLYTPELELFLERPPLVAAQPAELLVYLTWLADFSPVSGGEMTASLGTASTPAQGAVSGPGASAWGRAEASSPSRPGLYRLRLTPVRGGPQELVLAWADGDRAASFELDVHIAESGAPADALAPYADAHGHAPDHGHAGMRDHREDHDRRQKAEPDQEAAHGRGEHHEHHEHHEHGRDHDPDHEDHGSASAHDEQARQAAAVDGVQLTKEQQWRSDFATAVVERRALRGSVPATGLLRPSADGDAHVTTPIDAHLRPAEDGFPYTGMDVEPGQILAYLVPRLGGDADVAGLELAVARARTALDLASRERERLDALWEDRSIPFRDVLQARGDEEVAAAELTAARRRLAQVRRTEEGEGAGVPVRAPIGGVVARVEVAPGAFVEEGARLFHLVNPERLWLEARVAEADLGRIRTPTGAWFSVPGMADHGGQVFELTPATGARLVAFGAMVDPRSRTVPVIFELEPAAYENGASLRVGQSVSARVLTGEEAQTMAVPAGALINDAGAEVVYVQIAGDRFERRLVHTGLHDGAFIGVHEPWRLPGAPGRRRRGAQRPSSWPRALRGPA